MFVQSWLIAAVAFAQQAVHYQTVKFPAPQVEGGSIVIVIDREKMKVHEPNVKHVVIPCHPPTTAK